MTDTESQEDIYTEVPSSIAQPTRKSDPVIPSIEEISRDLETILSEVDSKHTSAYKRGKFVQTNDIYNNILKQYLYSLNLFISELVTSSTKSTSKKGLLYRRIFDIINSSYELLDTISQTKDTSEKAVARELNSALLGFTLKNTKILYDEYTNRPQRNK
jgi:hypothetical protein